MTTEPNDITADDIIPPVSAGRVRGIALVWLKPDATKAAADLAALANWLDRYHAMMREVLKESEPKPEAPADDMDGKCWCGEPSGGPSKYCDCLCHQ